MMRLIITDPEVQENLSEMKRKGKNRSRRIASGFTVWDNSCGVTLGDAEALGR